MASALAVAVRRRRRRAARRRLWSRLGEAAALLVLAWAVGFGWFVHRIVEPAAPIVSAGGIVVLTGGSGRAKEGFRLLLDGRAPRLLVSGVARDTSLAEIAGIAGVPIRRLAGEVDLGHRARSTEGNAEEAAAWAAARHLRSLILVTSFYHMPRALLEFRTVLPDVRLVPVAVYPRVPVFAWRPALWRVVVAEYCKWLAAEAGFVGPIPWPYRGAS